MAGLSRPPDVSVGTRALMGRLLTAVVRVEDGVDQVFSPYVVLVFDREGDSLVESAEWPCPDAGSSGISVVGGARKPSCPGFRNAALRGLVVSGSSGSVKQRDS